MREFVVTGESLATMLGRVMPHLDERQRRIVAGAAARLVGRGGIAAVAEATEMSRSTVQKATGEIDAQPGLLLALDDLVEPESRGDPMCPLRWTTKSTRALAAELGGQGFEVSHVAAAELLHDMGYSLQAPAKENEGTQHPDRDGQFHHLNAQIEAHLADGEPVVSVDTKKSTWSGRSRGSDEMLAGPAGRGRRLLIGAV